MSTFKQLQDEINGRIAEAEDAVIENRLYYAVRHLSGVDFVKLRDIAQRAIPADNKEQTRQELYEFLTDLLDIDNGLQRKRESGNASNTTIE